MSIENNGSSGSGNKFADAFGDSQLVADFGSVSSADDADDSIIRAEESTQDGLELDGEGGDPSTDSSETGEIAKASKQPEATQKTPGDKDVITVTDETGRKRKVEIDYSNKEQIKKVYAQAAGMRKFQAERDREIQSRKELESKHSQREADWNKLEQAFQGGYANLVNQLGGQGAWDREVEKEIARREWQKNATPDEIEASQARERAELTQKEIEKIRKENEEFKKQVSQEREQAEERAMESKIHPVFEKYRFAERLGNAQDEHLFDDMLWSSALKRLEQYEEKSLDITPELIEKEFRTVATALRSRIDSQAQKKAGQVITQKKQEATENVQSKVKSAHASSSDQEKLKQLIQSGDTNSIFKNWGTFGKLLGNKK